jgi:predicted amidohydrolase YtcJ
LVFNRINTHIMRTAFLLSIVLFLGCQESRKATLLLVNGHFFTATADTSRVVTTVAIEDDRIVYVGDSTGIAAWKGPKTQVIDLKGAFAMPGFIEGHGHFISLGQSLENVALDHTRNWPEVIKAVSARAATTPSGNWIVGRGWHQEKWRPRPDRVVDGYPYHDSLSALTASWPVVLYHASGHALLANDKAMQIAGISTETTDPVGGRIVRDANGRLTGVFEENAMGLIDRPLVAWENQRTEAQKQQDFDRQAKAAAKACIAKGITSFQDAGSNFWEIEQFKRLAMSGQLDLRLWAMIAQPKMSELDRLSKFPQVGLGNNHFTVRAVKAYLDGALGSYGAWLLQPYEDKPNAYGQNVTPVDSIAAIAAACREHNLQLCVHAIGDRANRQTLDIFQQALYRDLNPAEGVQVPNPAAFRWRIEHAQHISPVDQGRFWQLGVIASMQAVHCVSDAPFVVRRLGVPRARAGAYAWRALLDRGAHLANGTDTPVEAVDPLPCIYAAATRKRILESIPFFPEQCMSRREALLSYSVWNAYAAFEETEKGVLLPGFLADIVILSKDLLHCPADDILKAEVLQTIVGGRVKMTK